MSVWRRFSDDFHSDVPAGTAAIVENHLLLQILTESLSKRSADGVSPAARRVGNHEPDRFAWKTGGVLRMSVAICNGQQYAE
jgi:hypothetical protein